ncbi:MAG: hypothetical protein ACUZ8H_15520 [Candidatus Anammoxibacter sp.]
MTEYRTTTTLQKAITTTLDKARNKGCNCPCCGQFVKVYKRTINAAMALELATAYKRFGTYKAFHRSELKDILKSTGGGDFAKLRYWGLITELVDDNPKKKNSGRWVVTNRGEQFLGGAALYKYCLIYNGGLLDFDEDEVVYFKDCIANDFDFQGLMDG